MQTKNAYFPAELEIIAIEGNALTDSLTENSSLISSSDISSVGSSSSSVSVSSDVSSVDSDPGINLPEIEF